MPPVPGCVRAAPVLVLAAYAIACLFVWNSQWWWPEWDSALYILTGRSLAQGEGYRYLDRPFFLRPPGLSWMIAQVSGTGPLDAPGLNRMVMAWAAAATAAVYGVARRRLGVLGALAVALLFGTNALVASRFNRVESEFPFTALVFAGMAVLPRATDRAPALRAVLSGACLGAATLVRSAGIVAIPALLVLCLVPRTETPRRHAVLAALVAFGVALPWLLHARAVAKDFEAPWDQLLLHDYTTATFHVDLDDPASPWISWGQLGGRVVRNGSEALADAGRFVLGVESVPLGAALVVTALAGILLGVRRDASPIDSWTVGYAGLLGIYFVYHERFLLPLLPALYLHAACAIAAAIAAARRRTGAPRTVGHAAAAIAVALALAVNVAQWPSAQRTASDGARPWELAYRVAEQIRRNTDPSAVLLAEDAPIFSVLTDRRVYNYRKVPVAALLDRYDPDFVIVNQVSKTGQRFLEVLRDDPRHRWVRDRHLGAGLVWVYRAEPR